MSKLEKQYRRTLRWFPSAWRVRNEDAVVGTLLDLADEVGRTVPARFERLGLARDGIEVRIERVAPSVVRSGVSLVGLATGLGFSAVYFLFHAWSPWAPGPTYFLHDTFTGFGPFVNPGVLLCVAWVGGVGLALASKPAAMRSCMAVVFALSLALIIINHRTHGAWYGPSSMTLVLFAALAAAAMVGTPRRLGWLAIGSTISLALWTLDYVRLGLQFHTLGVSYADERSYLSSGIIATVTVTLFAVLPVAVIVLAIAKRLVVSSVVALSALPWLALVVTYLLSQRGYYDEWLQEFGQFATVSLVWVILIVVARRIGRHRLRTAGRATPAE